MCISKTCDVDMSLVKELAGYSNMLEFALISEDCDFYERFVVLRDEVWKEMLLCLGMDSRDYEQGGFVNCIIANIEEGMKLGFKSFVAYFKLLDKLSSNDNVTEIQKKFPVLLFCRHQLFKEVYVLLCERSNELATTLIVSWYPVMPSCIEAELRYRNTLPEEDE